MQDAPIVSFSTPEEWEAYLSEHVADEYGVWVKFFKKASGIQSLTYDQALDVALCYGWIDSIIRGFDEVAWIQKFTPRRKKSVWSKVNTGHIARLTEAGRMKPSGMLQVELAKADGRWDAAYDSAKTATVPDDFQAAMNSVPKAAEFFVTLKQSERYAMLYRLQTVKRQETRERKIKEFVALLAEGKSIKLL